MPSWQRAALAAAHVHEKIIFILVPERLAIFTLTAVQHTAVPPRVRPGFFPAIPWLGFDSRKVAVLAVVPGFAVAAPAAQPTAPRAAQTAETDETDETDETVQTEIAQTLTWFCDRTN